MPSSRSCSSLPTARTQSFSAGEAAAGSYQTTSTPANGSSGSSRVCVAQSARRLHALLLPAGKLVVAFAPQLADAQTPYGLLGPVFSLDV